MLSNLNSLVQRPLALVAEDDEDNLLLLTHILESFGISYVSTLDGKEVLRFAEIHRPDLILLDIIFPDFDGLEVIQDLKQNVSTSAIPVVAVTALVGEEYHKRLLQTGCQECLYKPYDIEDLEAILQRCLTPLLSAF